MTFSPEWKTSQQKAFYRKNPKNYFCGLVFVALPRRTGLAAGRRRPRATWRLALVNPDKAEQDPDQRPCTRW